MDKRTHSWMLNRIRQTKIVSTPFPHAFVEDIFPEGYYRTLLLALPETARYRVAESVYGFAKNRYDIWFTQRNLRRLPSVQARFWTTFQKRIADLPDAYGRFCDLLAENHSSTVQRFAPNRRAFDARGRSLCRPTSSRSIK
jgi:hypothetical protein